MACINMYRRPAKVQKACYGRSVEPATCLFNRYRPDDQRGPRTSCVPNSGCAVCGSGRQRPPAREGAVPAAPGGGPGRSAGRPAAPGFGSGSGPGTCESRWHSPFCPAPAAHGPVSPAARPPCRLLRPQLCGRLLHLPRLDGGLQPAGNSGYGGTRRYPGAPGALGQGCGRAGRQAGAGRRCQLFQTLLAGGASPGSGWAVYPKHPLAAQAPCGPGMLRVPQGPDAR